MLGALLILGCLPTSLVFGIIGIMRDTSKALAITITILALAACMIFFLGSLLSC